MIAVAYKELNEAEPDCGTTFTWATRAFGSSWGWMGGWGIFAADVIVMANLAQIAGSYGLPAGRAPTPRHLGLLGDGGRRHLDRRHDLHLVDRDRDLGQAPVPLLGIEIVILGLLAGTALIKVYSGNGVAESSRIQRLWFNPLTSPRRASSPPASWPPSSSTGAGTPPWPATRRRPTPTTRRAGPPSSRPSCCCSPMSSSRSAPSAGRARQPRHRPHQPGQLGRRAERAGHEHLRHRHHRDAP